MREPWAADASTLWTGLGAQRNLGVLSPKGDFLDCLGKPKRHPISASERGLVGNPTANRESVKPDS